ncbi:integral membrane sensor signal transduction histidine kinase [Clostridium sp. DL-VIII]|uniref:HAMP domain-containing sensor histidine kinase n=1 Tax=Clostridium sp. DL-VIII TaxID=641107 RepID=UPI00023AFC2E|nr:HAMP domain-containing sensor histidine kinase [Clostridium sp. DL-VIII]EHI99496.1 integral membrane sensor signal transduction histidine kinase [Clostridium sp. DL-VIII]
MKNKKLRTKITIRVGALLVLGGVTLNIVVKNIIDYSSNSTIKNDMVMQQNNSINFINEYFMVNSKSLDRETLISNSAKIAISLSENNNSTIGIYDDKGQLQYQNVKGEVNKKISEHIDKAKENKAYIYFSDENNDYKGYFAYPFYSNNEFIGIVEIIRDYKEIITNNRNIYLLFTLVESFFFLIILILTYLIMRESTRPIENLLKGVREIYNGNYGYEVLEHANKDEISDLAYEYNKMRRKIKKQIELTHHLEKTRRDFFCNITHELKTPLTSISGYAELLQTNFHNEKFRKQAINSIEKESDKLNSMISSILEVSRGQILSREKSEFNIGKMLNEISDEMRIRNNNCIKVKVNIEEGNILGIYDDIKSILINLLENAYKYSIENGDMDIAGYKESGFYNVIISNKSRNLNSDFEAKAFEPFIRGENANDMEGNGLGLYICKLIVEEHNGEIRIKILDNIVKVIVKLTCL